MNFSTVAVLAVTEDVPLSAFSFELLHSLSSHGKKKLIKKVYLCVNCIVGRFAYLHIWTCLRVYAKAEFRLYEKGTGN